MSVDLAQVIARTQSLFLDFDGPICSIFAGYPAPAVAGHLRHQLDAFGIEVSPAMLATDDPLQVLRLVGDQGDEAVTRRAASALRDAEVTAAVTADPTPDVDRVVEAALISGRRLAVVSNNSVEAVTAYLRRADLLSSFVCVLGRYDGMSPQLMKPNPHLLDLGLDGTGASPRSTTFVGDSASDIEAARAIPVTSIGYGGKPGRAELLADAGADVVITTMAELADALLEPTSD